jgi:hypothetical protein
MALRKMGGAILALRDGIYTFDFEEGQSELIIAIDEKIRALASTTARLIDAVDFLLEVWTRKKRGAWLGFIASIPITRLSN